MKTIKLGCGCVVSKIGETWYFDSLCKTHAKQYFDQHQAKKLHRLLNWALQTEFTVHNLKIPQY